MLQRGIVCQCLDAASGAVSGGMSAMEFVLLEKEKAEKIDRLLERYGRIQRRRAWHKRSRSGGKRK